MSKRQRFILISLLLSLGFVSTQFLDDRFRLYAIGALGFATIVLFIWSLHEGLGRNLTLLTLVLPTFFTWGVGFFWFLLPANMFARIPVVILYGLGIYVLCLTANIYTVSAIRTIALLRAARGVGFVLTLLTSFLVYDAILSIKEGLPFILLSTFFFSFPLFFQGLWSVVLESKYTREIFIKSVFFSFIMAQIAGSLYFWPITVVVGSLFLTVSVYVLLGLGQSKLEGRLFAQTVREYLVVAILVFIGMYFATRWGA